MWKLWVLTRACHSLRLFKKLSDLLVIWIEKCKTLQWMYQIQATCKTNALGLGKKTCVETEEKRLATICTPIGSLVRAKPYGTSAKLQQKCLANKPIVSYFSRQIMISSRWGFHLGASQHWRKGGANQLCQACERCTGNYQNKQNE